MRRAASCVSGVTVVRKAMQAVKLSSSLNVKRLWSASRGCETCAPVPSASRSASQFMDRTKTPVETWLDKRFN